MFQTSKRDDQEGGKTVETDLPPYSNPRSYLNSLKLLWFYRLIKIDGKIENFTRELESIKKNQMEILN